MARKNIISAAGGEPSETVPNRTHMLRALIRKCRGIPRQVTEAEFSRVDERLIDESFFRMITQHGATDSSDAGEAAKIQRRIDALSPYIGRHLVCVMITLPGVRYTIEVDPSDERVIHWEWQSG